ncbi:MAG TPA: Hsp70 family protein, partial [Kofleriaceae bacterium]|nr:Hsp70 family protein [Kofleriaceae bacterium]
RHGLARMGARIDPSLTRFRLVAACAATAVGFAVVKLCPPVAEALAGLIVKRTGYDIHRDAVRWSELVFRCEMAKRQLTAAAEVPFAMRDAYVAGGRAHHLDFKLERSWVEERWAPLFEGVVIAIWDALRRAGWRREDVDQVALIGGSALVPLFQRTVAGVFPGQAVVLAPRADVAVGIGAVLLTARFGAEPRAVPVLDALVGAT